MLVLFLYQEVHVKRYPDARPAHLFLHEQGLLDHVLLDLLLKYLLGLCQVPLLPRMLGPGLFAHDQTDFDHYWEAALVVELMQTLHQGVALKEPFQRVV